MTNEEWDRKTEFLLNQQAKFDAGMQELREAQARSDQKIEQIAEKAEHALNAVSQLADMTAELISTMTQGFRSAFDRIKQTDDKIDALVNSQIRTDERMRDTDKRLRALTDLIERFIRGHQGRNGLEN